MRALALTVVVLVVPASAQAVTLLTPDGQVAQPYQRWADRSLVPTAKAQAVVVAGRFAQITTCGDDDPATTGCLAGPPYTIWVGGDPDERPFTLLHEVGHIFDQTVMTGAARAGYQKIIEREDRPWVVPGDYTHSPQERFANSYAFCGTGAYHTRRARRVCALIKRQAARVSGRN